jgi:hypothetical protein
MDLLLIISGLAKYGMAANILSKPLCQHGIAMDKQIQLPNPRVCIIIFKKLEDIIYGQKNLSN